MSRNTTLAALLSVMLVATALVVWDVGALDAADAIGLDGPVCAYISEPPCPTTFDCGYRFDGTCCIPRCPRTFCLGICFVGEPLTP